MSSILDSLKKLEKETASQDQLPTHVSADRKGFISKYVIGIIVGISLGIGAIGLTAYYKGSPKKVTEPVARDIVPAPMPAAALDEPEKPLAPSQDTQTPLPTQPIEGNTTPSAAAPEVKNADSISTAKPMPTEDDGPQQNVIPESEQAVALKEPLKEDQVKETALEEPEPQTTAAQEDISNLLDDVSPKEPAKKKEPMQIDSLEGVGFKIQAISWSETPEQSLAVINSQILREGDGIEGYHISRINPDDIVLQRGGKSYRLDFRSTGLP